MGNCDSVLSESHDHFMQCLAAFAALIKNLYSKNLLNLVSTLQEQGNKLMFSSKLSVPSLLAQVPLQHQHTVLLPPEEAFHILRPVLNQHAVLRAVDGFGQWIFSRNEHVSLEQAADLWVNYETVFIKELPKRCWQWNHDHAGHASPFALGVQFGKMLRLRRWESFVIRKSGSVMGRLQIKLLQAMGNFITFLVFFPLALSVWNELANAREKILMGESLLSCLVQFA